MVGVLMVVELLASGVLGLLSSSKNVAVLQPAPLSSWLSQAPVSALMAPTYAPDPEAIAALDTYLQTLERLGLDPEQQGVWVQSGANIWAEHQGTIPLSAASLTKLVTTLAALETWGGNHQFETLISTTGTVQNGVLNGDLVVQGGGDPLYVWEEAIALANTLQQLGIEQIAGRLIVSDRFSMNYEDSALTSGQLLQQAFDSNRWSRAATDQHLTMPPGTPKPTLQVTGAVRVMPHSQIEATPLQPLVVHRSLPLAQLLKLMNIYSNNVMSQVLADAMGGADQMAAAVSEWIQVGPAEIQIINGSGLGQANQLSSRAVGRMLLAIHHHLQATPWALADVLPVSGRDSGTLKGRRIPRSAAVKTGSLWNVSALAGAMPTAKQEVVWFVIINRGTNLDQMRQQQDQFLNALVAAWGQSTVVPPSLQPGVESVKPEYQVGASQRIQVVAMP